jgi:dolichyl-phosphate-mannose-protein mannosyltransferase
LVSLSLNKRDLVILAVVLVGAFAIRMLLYPLQGYPIDTNDFTAWFNTASSQGIGSFYNNTWCDYPPFNVYIFWAAGSLANTVSALGVNVVNIIKLTPTVFDLATSTLIFFFLRKQFSFNQTISATVLYAFNPAVILNVSVWGQFDAIYTFFLVLSLIVALKKKPETAAVIFAIGLLTKPQGIALLPLIALLIYMKNGAKRLLASIGAFVATIFIVILPFEWSNPITFLSNIYFGAFNGYQYTSINAFNLWGLFGLWVPDGSFFILGWSLFGASAAFALFVTYKQYKISGDALAIFCAFMLFFAFFMLPTRIHERYLFPALSVLALLLPLYKKSRILYGTLTATVFVNEAYVLYWLNSSYPGASPNLTGDPVVLVISIINLVMFLYASILMFDIFRGRKMTRAAEQLTKPAQESEVLK